MTLVAAGFFAGLFITFGKTVTLVVLVVIITVIIVVVIFTLGVLYGSLTLRAGSKIAIEATSVNDEYDIQKTKHLAGLMEQTIKTQANTPVTDQRLGRLEETMGAILQLLNPKAPQQQITTWDDIKVKVDEGDPDHMDGDFSIFGLEDDDDDEEDLKEGLPGIYAGLPR